MDLPLAELAHPDVVSPWTVEARTRIERTIWLAVLEYHVECGVASRDDLTAYHRTRHVDTHELAAVIERTTRHDVKARIEAWNRVAGREAIHLGMTSADIVDNAAQVQLRDAALALDRTQMGAWSGRPLQESIGRYPLRGIWGAVGTGMDQAKLTGRPDAAREATERVRHYLGFKATLDSVGQQYPRSLDLDICATAVGAARAAGGHRGLLALADGYLTMLAGISGVQWAEGDVSSSVVRRVALPGLMLACSAALRVEHATGT